MCEGRIKKTVEEYRGGEDHGCAGVDLDRHVSGLVKKFIIG